MSTQVRWGFEGLAVNEFEGLEFKPFTQIGRPSLKTGADALARLSFEDSTIRRTAVAQGAILGACYLQTYRVLKNARPRYATLKRATVVDDGIRWTADAEARLQKIPDCRGRVSARRGAPGRTGYDGCRRGVCGPEAEERSCRLQTLRQEPSETGGTSPFAC